jgi:hypothetical protein
MSLTVMDMLNVPRLPRPRKPRYHLVAAFGLGLALVVTGAPGPGLFDGTVSAQASDPCALITVDDVEPLAGKASVANGVSNSVPGFGYVACRYVWGEGVGRFKLDVVVLEPSRKYPGMSPEQIKQRLVESVRAGTADAVIPEIGEAAVFKPASPVYASATALVKGHILELHLDGAFAQEQKDQVVGLLKTAASRL